MKLGILIALVPVSVLAVLSWKFTYVDYRKDVNRGSIGTLVFNIAAPWVGQIKAGRTCGLRFPIPGTRLADSLKFRIDTAVGLGVMYAFSCPEPGKDTI
ncbi:hypothetical protein [Pseudooceanicola nitratireducens]|uniref:hypothetical protein n=1 Tax=Pseudooceanicola nitratireducens TaxID=517719 RepID=UPI001114188E|nr:hypothetical protein [Pseudooceanicola nitratireducens]